MAAAYDRFTAATEAAGLAEWRRDLLADLNGVVVELGAGTGHNLRWYTSAVDRLVLTEPDPHMRARLEARVAEQRRVVGVGRRDAQRLLGPRPLGGDRAARGDEFGAGAAQREIARVARTHPPEAGDADADPRGAHPRLTIRASRHEVVAASASSSARTPSSMPVRIGLPVASDSKKCAISTAYATR